MPHELSRDATLAIELLLEGKNHQHLVHVFANALDAALLPGPQLRTDVIDNRDSLRVKLAGQAQVEVRKVDQHGCVGASPFRFAHDLAKAAIDVGNVLDDLDDADLGDLARVD